MNPETRLALASALWGFTPHRGQRNFLISPAKTRVAACGRRWGKTRAVAVDLATYALANPGSVQMLVSPTYDQSRLAFDEVDRLLNSHGFLRRRCKTTRTPYPRIVFNGAVIMARTADDDGKNLRGHGADRLFVDEAAFIKDSVVESILRPMLADRDGSLAMISTPWGRNHFSRAFVAGLTPGHGVASFRGPSWQNPHISRAYIDQQRELLSPNDFAREYEAEFTDAQTAVFPSKLIDRALGQEFIPLRGCVAAGVDFARYSDYTAVVVAAPASEGWCVREAVRIPHSSWDEQVSEIHRILRKHGVAIAACDQTGVGDPAMEMLHAKCTESVPGISVFGVVFTHFRKASMVHRAQVAFERGMIDIPHDRALLEELEAFESHLAEGGTVKLEARSGSHDDLVMALCLALEAAEYNLGGAVLAARPFPPLDPTRKGFWFGNDRLPPVYDRYDPGSAGV